MDLSIYPTQKINELREQLNLTDDELVVFNMLAKNKSRIQIAEKLKTSTRTVDNRIARIKRKMKEVL